MFFSSCPTQTAAAALGGLLRAGRSWQPGCSAVLTVLAAAAAMLQCSVRSKAGLFDIVVQVLCQL
jgi:hypothetical protein